LGETSRLEARENVVRFSDHVFVELAIPVDFVKVFVGDALNSAEI
jgi:hypothetical protein